tara:strand:+ start:594 stop:875 length:282 start_codon:yes stop_codon:yes gene_type:complete
MKQCNFPQGVPNELLEAFLMDNEMESKGNDFFEDAGGHIWHESNIEEEIQNMGILEILDLQKVWNEQKDFFEEQTKWFIENDLKHPLGVINND